MSNCISPVCATSACSSVFETMAVYPKITGGSRVEWTLTSRFTDPPPHTFQLQTGPTALADADDWVNVDEPEVNVFSLVDPDRHVYGKTQWTHYRVKLTTSRGVYYSHPQSCFGVWSHREWRLAREIIRRELVNFRKGVGGQEGYLIKMRYTGSPCPRCLDYQSQEVRDADCEVCLGTGIVKGYYDPVPCVYAALDSSPEGDRRTGEGYGGMQNDVRATARMLAIPQIATGDVWVDANSDFRWVIRDIQHISELRGVPLVVKVQLRLAPFSNTTVYGIELPSQDDTYPFY